MKFLANLAIKNIKSRPARSIALGLLVAFLALILFGGTIIVLSLQNGLNSYEARLGADIVVVPYSATSHGTFDDILLEGITGNYYMSGYSYNQIKNITLTDENGDEVEVIEKVTAQFYLTSAKASCCSTRVQIIGFDPETDFVIQPWIAQSYKSGVSDGEVIVGANISASVGDKVKFYNQKYTVVAKLAETGTGLDSAVYTNMATIKEMAQNASELTEEETFRGTDINTSVSAVFIKVKDGYDIQDVTDQINLTINKIKASSASSMVSSIASGLSGISTIIGVFMAIIWVLAVAILIISFVMINNSRKKEMAVFRIMGASRSMIGKELSIEAAILSSAGALVGLILAVIIVLPLTSIIKSILGLPYLLPSAWLIIVIAIVALIVSVLAGMVTSTISSHKITKSEESLLLREDA